MLANCAIDFGSGRRLGGRGVGDNLEVKAGKLSNSITWKLTVSFIFLFKWHTVEDKELTEFGVGDSERNLLLILDLVEQTG